MKEIIKQAKNPIKNRIIPPDIIEKYNKKLQSLEADVERILQEEKNEKELAKIENQANRVEKLLKDENVKGCQRSWFQTRNEKKKEKGKQESCVTHFNIFCVLLSNSSIQSRKLLKFFVYFQIIFD